MPESKEIISHHTFMLPFIFNKDDIEDIKKNWKKKITFSKNINNPLFQEKYMASLTSDL